ncbi:hypothetical protein ACTXT7_013785 [Hymenolepis weldensis]
MFPKAAIPLIYLHYYSFDISSQEHGRHIRPNATNDLDLQHSWKSWNADTISDETPIFLYFHGMAFNRAHPHRVEVYKLLSRLGYHVMTIDYRGFGNSGGYPKGELDVVADAISLLRYARSLAPHSPVFIWGSSLGTGLMLPVLTVVGLAKSDLLANRTVSRVVAQITGEAALPYHRDLICSQANVPRSHIDLSLAGLI